MKYYKYADMFPMMNEEDLQILADDIKENGLIDEIVLFEGDILDGRNRFEACKMVKVKPKFSTLVVKHPLQYVISTNLKRRHLNTSQRALIAAEIANMAHGGVRRKNQESKSPFGFYTIKEAADMLNIGVNSVKDARELKRDHPERVVDVQSGKRTVSSVVKETRKEDQIKKRESNDIINNDFKLDKLFNGDSVDILKTFPDDIVDCILMDPPWGVDYTEDGRRESFTPDFDDSTENAFKILDEVCKELKRVSKDNVHVYCFFGMDNYQRFYDILNKYFTIEKQPLIWVKSNHTLRDFSKGYAYQYEPIFFGTNRERLLRNKLSRNILNYNSTTHKIHKTQKPLDLLQYLIDNSTVIGEVVIDPFMGSGSSCKAAKNLSRKYIGIEKDRNMFNLSKEFVNEDGFFWDNKK